MNISEVNSKIVSLIKAKRVECISLKDSQINKILEDNSYITFCSNKVLSHIVERLCEIYPENHMSDLLYYFNLSFPSYKKHFQAKMPVDFIIRLNCEQFIMGATYSQIVELFENNVFKCKDNSMADCKREPIDFNYSSLSSRIINVISKTSEFLNFKVDSLEVQDKKDFLWLQKLSEDKQNMFQSAQENRILFLISSE